MVDLNTGGYATEADLAAWMTPETVPDNWPTLLRYATIAVAEATQRNPFTDTPDTGDAAVLSAATCAQAASWIALGVDPAKAGTDMPGPVKSSTILDAKVDRDTSAATALAAEVVKGLCDTARDLLQTAGLLWVPVPLGDTCGRLPSWGLDGPRHWGVIGERGPELDGWPFY